MIKKIPLLLFLAFFFFFTSCSLIKPLSIGEIDSVQLNSLQGNTITLTTSLPIKNDNAFKVTIVGIDLDFGFNGDNFGKVSDISNLEVPAHSNNKYSVKFDVQLQNLLKSTAILMKLMTQPQVKIKLNGHLNIQAIGFVKKIKIEQENLVNLKEK